MTLPDYGRLAVQAGDSYPPSIFGPQPPHLDYGIGSQVVHDHSDYAAQYTVLDIDGIAWLTTVQVIPSMGSGAPFTYPSGELFLAPDYSAECGYYVGDQIVPTGQPDATPSRCNAFWHEGTVHSVWYGPDINSSPDWGQVMTMQKYVPHIVSVDVAGVNTAEPDIWDVAYVYIRPDLAYGDAFVDDVQAWQYGPVDTPDGQRLHIIKYPKPPLGTTSVTVRMEGATSDSIVVPYADPAFGPNSSHWRLDSLTPNTAAQSDDPLATLGVSGFGQQINMFNPFREVILSNDPTLGGETVKAGIDWMNNPNSLLIEMPLSNTPGAYGWNQVMYVRLPQFKTNPIDPGVAWTWT